MHTDQHMGKTQAHHDIAVNVDATKKSVGVSLNPGMQSAWENLIVDFNLSYEGLILSGETLPIPPVVQVDGTWVQLVGESNAGSFDIYLPLDAAIELVRLADNNVDLAALPPADAALVFEEIASYRLTQIEQVIGAELSFRELVLVETKPLTPLLGFSFELYGTSRVGGLAVRGQLEEWFEYIISQRAAGDEKHLNPIMQVYLGPVVLPSQIAYLVKPGETIDCGVLPSDTIHGLLMRADGKYWPVFVEDDSVEICGELAGPAVFCGDVTQPVFLTFCLGQVELDAYSRSQLEVGSKIRVERIPENGTGVYFQNQPFGDGHLTILDENLAVTINKIEGQTDVR